MDSATTRLDRVAIKSGVSLGHLAAADRDAVLAFAAMHVPVSAVLDERGVNAVLVAFLRQGGAMLRTDHVELRRWLVDAGWLERDGFGRRYALAAQAPVRAAACLGDVSAERLAARCARLRTSQAEARRLRREQHVAAA